MSTASDSTTRFSNRAAYYAACRTGYAPAIAEFLVERAGLPADAVVADIGAGTGLSTELFLPFCAAVFAVEPNAEMRAVAEERLGSQANFHSVAGTAEATTLADGMADLVSVGSAFHWFEQEKCRVEFGRILKPGGKVAILTNRWHGAASPFMAGYEAIVLRYANLGDRPHWDDDEMAAEFFGVGGFETLAGTHAEPFSFERLAGLTLSFSVMPLAGEPGHEEMMSELTSLFESNQSRGVVEYHTKSRIFFGACPAPAAARAVTE